MNLYEKINKTKQALQSAGLKKSGRNDFAKYEYFELADFMPTIVQMENDLKFICAVSFDKDLAVLEVIDGEKPEDRHSYTSPMSSASLKGMHDVQNLGAVQTYLRRYLYVNAFEIVEHDTLDKSKPAEQYKHPAKPPAQKKPDTLTDAQRDELGDMVKNDMDQEQAKQRLKELVESLGVSKLSEVKQADFEELKNKFLEYGLPFSMGGNK